MFDEETVDATTTTPNRQNANVSNEELAEFRAFRESKIREAGVAEGQHMASAEYLANEAAADAAALKRLTDRNLTLGDAFGNRSTDRGRGLIVNLHRSQFGVKSDYSRLRRMAVAAKLVQ
jgi:hypothetical protein